MCYLTGIGEYFTPIITSGVNVFMYLQQPKLSLSENSMSLDSTWAVKPGNIIPIVTK